MKFHQDTVRELAAELDQYVGRGRDPQDPGAEVNVLELPTERHAELERALRATLDTATHRMDPWVTGIAWRRLDQHAQSGRARHRLGAYGWLDGPFRGTPGPNARASSCALARAGDDQHHPARQAPLIERRAFA